MKGFNKLDIDSKSIMLHYNGTMLASVKHYNFRVTLYAVRNSLIEEYYDTASSEITRISIAHRHDLKKYLDKVDIGSLFNAGR
ncbi:MAG TPA: hypothetical protein VD927_19205 [Chryseosolibacter sp.]|nr:hypothetical protein [Chryseosolibacter sp.]